MDLSMTFFFFSHTSNSLFGTDKPCCLLASPFLVTSFLHPCSVTLYLTFIPILCNANLKLTKFSSICSLLSPQVIVHGNSCLTTCINVSITTGKGRCLMQSHFHLKPICSHCTPHCLNTCMRTMLPSYMSSIILFLLQHNRITPFSLTRACSLQRQCNSF